MYRSVSSVLGTLTLLASIAGSTSASAAYKPTARLSFFSAPLVTSAVPHRLETVPKAARLKTRTPAHECVRHKSVGWLMRKYAHALKLYTEGKTRTILQRHVTRIKSGQTLSQIIPDYRNYRLMLRLRNNRTVPVRRHRVQTGHYIWKEGGNLVMSSDVLLMRAKERRTAIERGIRQSSKRWPSIAYMRQADRTLRTAERSPFKLDCNHANELERLVDKAYRDLIVKDRELIISPGKFGNLLTILRAYITFNHFKSLPHREFERRFRQLVDHEGSHSWSHKKLYRLLGLHVIGQIESNADFRRTYDHAINRAARRYPNVPRKWIEQIIWIESRGDPKTISRAGAYGLMQLMPLAYLGQGSDKVKVQPLAFEQTINPFNPETNIERGAAFIDKLRQHMWPKIRRYGRIRRKRMIFHAYNAGASRVLALVKKHGRHYEGYLPDETKLYMKRLADFPRR